MKGFLRLLIGGLGVSISTYYSRQALVLQKVPQNRPQDILLSILSFRKFSLSFFAFATDFEN